MRVYNLTISKSSLGNISFEEFHVILTNSTKSEGLSPLFTTTDEYTHVCFPGVETSYGSSFGVEDALTRCSITESVSFCPGRSSRVFNLRPEELCLRLHQQKMQDEQDIMFFNTRNFQSGWAYRMGCWYKMETTPNMHTRGITIPCPVERALEILREVHPDYYSETYLEAVSLYPGDLNEYLEFTELKQDCVRDWPNDDGGHFQECWDKFLQWNFYSTKARPALMEKGLIFFSQSEEELRKLI